MTVRKNNTKQVSLISKKYGGAIPNVESRNEIDKQSYSYTSKGTMHVKHVSQTEIKTIGIFKNEWDFISNSINEINEKTSNWSLGNYLEGVLGTLFLPFIIELWKLISNPQASNIAEIQGYCKFYLTLIVLFIIIYGFKKIAKPKFLQTYKDFENDIKHINQRIIEINSRIGMEKENEE